MVHIVDETMRIFKGIVILFWLGGAAFAQPGWGPDARLCYLPGGSYEPHVVASGDTVHVVWRQTGSSDTASTYTSEVWYKRSTDEGETWSSDTLLSREDSASSYDPDIAANGPYVYVVWIDTKGRPNYNYQVSFRRSTDGGMSWSSIDSLMTGPMVRMPRVAACGDSVYVAATLNDYSSPAGFRKSTDHGATWQPLVDLENGNYPSLAVRGSLVYVSWENYRQGVITIYAQRSMDGGRTFEPGRVISDTTPPILGSQKSVVCADYLGNPHVIWPDYKYSPYPWTGDIFYRTSVDSAGSWLPFDTLCVEHRATWSDIVDQGDTLHVAWQDDRVAPDPRKNFEIFYRMSTDLGLTWETEWRLTYARGNSEWPAMSLGRRYLHLVWRDGRDDTLDIPRFYYKRKSLEPSGVKEGQRGKATLGEPSLFLRVFPNPSKADVALVVKGAEEGKVLLEIYDAIGRAVCTISGSVKKGSSFFWRWDGKDEEGKEVAEGVYILRVVSGRNQALAKIVKVHGKER